MELPKEKKVPYSFFSLCPPTSCCHHGHFCPREAGTVLDLEYALGTGEGNRKARASRFLSARGDPGEGPGKEGRFWRPDLAGTGWQGGGGVWYGWV